MKFKNNICIYFTVQIFVYLHISMFELAKAWWFWPFPINEYAHPSDNYLAEAKENLELLLKTLVWAPLIFAMDIISRAELVSFTL